MAQQKMCVFDYTQRPFSEPVGDFVAALHPFVNVLYSPYYAILRQVDALRGLFVVRLLSAARSRMEQQYRDQATFIQQVADTFIQRGWRGPALVLLEAGRPLAFVGGQLFWLAQPALSLLTSTQRLERLARLLEDGDAVDALILQLEQE